MEEKRRHLKATFLAVLFLPFDACEFSHTHFCSWEPNIEATASFMAQTCAVILDSEERGFLVTKYLGFLLLGRITAAFLFSLEKGWIWSSITTLC